MKVVEGYALFKYTPILSDKYIYELAIHRCGSPFPEDFYFLHDESNNIVRIKIRSRGKSGVEIVDGYILYKIGVGIYKYDLEELKGETYKDTIILGDKKYTLRQSLKIHRYTHIHIENSTLIYTTVDLGRRRNLERYSASDFCIKYLSTVYKHISQMELSNPFGISEFIGSNDKLEHIYTIVLTLPDTILYISMKYFNNNFYILLLDILEKNTLPNILSALCKVDLFNYNMYILTIGRLRYQCNELLYENIILPPKVILELINNVLLERQIVLYSTSPNKIYKVISYLLNIIRPFKYKYFINTCVYFEDYDLMDMPFPFLIGICEAPENIKSTVVFVNIDSGKMTNIYKNLLPFKKRLYKRIKHIKEGRAVIFHEYMTVLKNNIDIKREEVLFKALVEKDKEELESIIHSPKVFSAHIMSERFFVLFGNTQIFRLYNIESNRFIGPYKQHLIYRKGAILEECTGIPIFTCDRETYCILLLLFPKIAKYLFEHISDNLKGLLSILSELLVALSKTKDYDFIFYIYEFIIYRNIRLPPEFYKAINYTPYSKCTISIKNMNAYRLSTKECKLEIYKNGEVVSIVDILSTRYLHQKLIVLIDSETVLSKESNPSLYWNIIYTIVSVGMEYFSEKDLPELIN